MNNNQPLRPWYVIGNWKMNYGTKETVSFFERWAKLKPLEYTGVIGAIAPPWISISTMKQLAFYPLKIAAQDISAYSVGAYTGECSGVMLKELNCQFVIVGHSERRQYHKESDSLLVNKIKQVHHQGMCPIFCVGESLQQREEGIHRSVVSSQLYPICCYLKDNPNCSFLIAYEPIWAIGTGKVASYDDAQEVHNHIRNEIEIKISQERASCLPILYGGSIKPNNATGFIQQDDIDGLLIGGSSLDPNSFYCIFTDLAVLRRNYE